MSSLSILFFAILCIFGCAICPPKTEKAAKEWKLKNIFVYPIKSCGYIKVSKDWPLTETGLKYDRNWMIVNENGAAMSQTKYPQFSLIKPMIDEESRTLTLQYYDPRSDKPVNLIRVPLNCRSDKKKLIQSKVVTDVIDGIDCGDEVASWLSTVTKLEGLRLLKITKRHSKDGLPGGAQLSLASMAQMLVIPVASVEWFIKELKKDKSQIDYTVDSVMDRFRPNLVISGNMKPNSELAWKEFYIGPIHFLYKAPCIRCAMINTDQRTSVVTKEILPKMGDLTKKNNNGQIVFGIYVNIDYTSSPSPVFRKLTIGDPVSLKPIVASRFWNVNLLKSLPKFRKST